MDYTLFLVTQVLVIIASVGCQQNTQSDSTRCKETGAICVNLTRCPAVLKLIKTYSDSENPHEKTKLTSLACGFDGITPMVCCSSDSESAIVFTNTSDEVATNKPSTSTTTLPVTTPETIINRQPEKERTDLFPDRSVCGQIGIPDRIVGGTLAAIDEFPWLARIRYKNPSPKNEEEKDSFLCLASLITEQYLVSAAHCYQSKLVRRAVSVRLGEWNTESPGDCDYGVCNYMPVEVEIDSVIVHPDYLAPNTFKATGDIALIRLKQPVIFTEFIQPVCLPTTKYVQMQDYTVGSAYTAAGWGVTEFGSISAIKRKVELPAVSMDICKVAIPDIQNMPSRSIICAGGKKNQDTCVGDSGGPLMRAVGQDYAINWYLYGITSVGSRHCGTEGYPGIYTRVTAYMDWIQDVIRNGTRTP